MSVLLLCSWLNKRCGWYKTIVKNVEYPLMQSSLKLSTYEVANSIKSYFAECGSYSYLRNGQPSMLANLVSLIHSQAVSTISTMEN